MPAVAAKFDQGRRIKAARILAGLNSPEALAAEISEAGLSGKTLRNIEAPGNPKTARDRDLHAIARACDLPYEWFTVDFARLPELTGNDGALSEDQMRAAVERVLSEARLAVQGRPRAGGATGKQSAGEDHPT